MRELDPINFHAVRLEPLRVPLRRPGRADEVARLVGLLFEADIGYLTGETIYLDGALGINQQ